MKFFHCKYQFFITLILGLANFGMWAHSGFTFGDVFGIFALFVIGMSLYATYRELWFMRNMCKDPHAMLAAILLALEDFPKLSSKQLLNYLALRHPFVPQWRIAVALSAAYEARFIVEAKS